MKHGEVGIMNGPGLGALPSPPDARDAAYALDVAGLSVPIAPGQIIPCDHRGDYQPIQNQGSYPDCVMYAVVDHASAEITRVLKKDILGSHIFTGYEVRSTERTTGQLVGTYPRDALASLAREGLCPMHAWPDGGLFRDLDPHTWKSWFAYVPDLTKRWEQGYWLPQDPFYVAAHHRITTYRAVPVNADAIQAALANGFDVTWAGLITAEAMGVGPDGNWAYMDMAHNEIMGGHAMTTVGRLADGRWITRQSWGANWGDHGWCYLDPHWFDAVPPAGRAPAQPYEAWTIHAVAK